MHYAFFLDAFVLRRQPVSVVHLYARCVLAHLQIAVDEPIDQIQVLLAISVLLPRRNLPVQREFGRKELSSAARSRYSRRPAATFRTSCSGRRYAAYIRLHPHRPVASPVLGAAEHLRSGILGGVQRLIQNHYDRAIPYVQ